MSIKKLLLGCSVTGYAICSMLAACTYDAPTAGSGGAGGGAGMGGNGGQVEAAPWWDDAWKKRVRITFQNANSESLNDFQVMVRLDKDRIGETLTSATGADLRFIDDDGKTILAHEIEQWMPGGDSFVWVRVPRIEGTDTDHMWLYYDNQAAADEANPTEVWKEYLGVYHLTPSLLAPDEFPDSTQTLNGSWMDYDPLVQSAPTVPGIASRAADFDGIRYIHLGENDHVAADVNEARTVEAWVRPAKVQDQAIVYEEGECVGWFLGTTAAGEYLGNFITDSMGEPCDLGIAEYKAKATPVEIGVWRHLTLVVDRPNKVMSLYIDGKIYLSVFIDNTNLADGNGIFRIGSDHDGVEGTFDGAIDEVRVTDGARSAGWIAAQYKSMKDLFLVFTME